VPTCLYLDSDHFFLDFVHGRELLFQENMTNIYVLITKLLFTHNKKLCYFFLFSMVMLLSSHKLSTISGTIFCMLRFQLELVGRWLLLSNGVIRLEQMALVGYLILIADISLFG
jgi:hypothetical protein